MIVIALYRNAKKKFNENLHETISVKMRDTIVDCSIIQSWVSRTFLFT